MAWEIINRAKVLKDTVTGKLGIQCGCGSDVQIVSSEPLVLYAEDAELYLEDTEAGDEALDAIMTGRPVLVRVPNADGGKFTAIYSPVVMNHVPNYENEYLYLLFLNDGLNEMGLPSYNQLKLKLSKKYNMSPLEKPLNVTLINTTGFAFELHSNTAYRGEYVEIDITPVDNRISRYDLEISPKTAFSTTGLKGKHEVSYIPNMDVTVKVTAVYTE